MLERIDKARHNAVIADKLINHYRKERHLDFLYDVKLFYKDRGYLTPGQERYLESIEGIYSDKAIEEAKNWSTSYSDDLRDVAVKCAKYYEASEEGYFSFTVKKVLDDPKGHVLSKVEFDKMCANKYAVKVLNEYKNKPKYSVGQLVEGRPNTYYKGDIGVVTSVNYGPITRACKGAIPYRGKFIKVGRIAEVIEKEIKAVKGRK